VLGPFTQTFQDKEVRDKSSSCRSCPQKEIAARMDLEVEIADE